MQISLGHATWSSHETIKFTCEYCGWVREDTMAELVGPMLEHQFIEDILKRVHERRFMDFVPWILL